MRPIKIKPRPTTVQPKSISFLGPILSTRKPTIGSKIPVSNPRREKATDVIAALQPKVVLIGLKRTVKPYMNVPPIRKFKIAEIHAIHQP